MNGLYSFLPVLSKGMYIFCDWQKFRRRGGACAFFLQFQGSSQFYFSRDSSLIAFNDSVVFERSLIWEINPTPQSPTLTWSLITHLPGQKIVSRWGATSFPGPIPSFWARPGEDHFPPSSKIKGGVGPMNELPKGGMFSLSHAIMNDGLLTWAYPMKKSSLLVIFSSGNICSGPFFSLNSLYA